MVGRLDKIMGESETREGIKTETREVASLQSDFSQAMSGFGKSEATVPHKTQACCWPKLAFVLSLWSWALQASQVKCSHVCKQRKRPLTLDSLSCHWNSQKDSDWQAFSCLVPVPEGLPIKSHSLSRAPCSVKSRFPGEALSESQGENQAESWRPLSEYSQFTHMRRLREQET